MVATTRRSLFKGLLSLVALSALPRRLLALARNVSSRRVRPSDPAWPADQSWRALDAAAGGALIRGVPSLTDTLRAEPAAEAAKDLHNPFFVGDQPAGTQVSGWLDAWAPAPSAYALKARRTGDVVAAVDFARQNNLRLVVKGAGHSYQGTSTAPDSLLIWTRAMNAVKLHERFVPRGCEGRVEPAPAVTAEAGCVWIDLYHAVTTQAGRYVQGGGCADVGVAGLVQSGGFGSLSKGFGSAASSLLEAEIVTADGKARVVNALCDPDLFWAIKGGGGGSWGVVTRLTLRTHELPRYFGYAWGRINARSDGAFRRLLAHFFGFYAESLLNPHWGEQVVIGRQNSFKLSMVCQGLDGTQVRAVWQPFFDWVNASPQDFSLDGTLGAGADEARHWWDVQGNDSMIPDVRPGVPAYHGWWRDDQGQVGAFVLGYDSLWLPATLLGPDRRQVLTEALFAASRHHGVELHFNKGLAGAPAGALAAARETATNPQVCEAFALAIIAAGEGAAAPGTPLPTSGLAKARNAAREVALAAAELRKIAPAAGSYVAESNFFNPEWQHAFWGDNYPRLQAVKAKYDPEGLFFVHHGVGTEGWSADGFSRTGV